MYLTEEAIRENLDADIIGSHLEIQKTVTSTNDLTWEAAEKGAEEGWTLLAEYQTEGRGRQGGTWFSPRSSGVLASILLRPPAVSVPPSLTIGTALAICRAVEANTPLKCEVKWPNDVLIDGKKIAGVLVESRVLGKELPVYVVGIGLNVNLSRPAFPKELRQTCASLRSLSKKMYDRNPIVTAFLNEMDRNYQLIRERHWSGLEVEFFERLKLADQSVTVKTAKETHGGLFRAFSIDEGITLEEGNERHCVPVEHIQTLSQA